MDAAISLVCLEAACTDQTMIDQPEEEITSCITFFDFFRKRCKKRALFRRCCGTGKDPF